ncbi:toll/interleukin-1 receptor domain-containing protein, partial [Frankia sp. CpI1-P]
MVPSTAPSLEENAPIYDVFFSYSHANQRIVRDIRDRLMVAGIRVWMDEAQNAPGDPWQVNIIDGLTASRT